MEEHRDEPQPVLSCRTAQWWLGILVLACLTLRTVDVNAAGARKHFDLEAGDASVMLNEFSRQSDLQVLFDFNIVRGMRTQPVSGDLETSVALKSMLKGTNLVFDFVNDRTLAVTPKKPSFLERLWHRLNTRSRPVARADDPDEVLISRSVDRGTEAMLGAPTLQLGRVDIERSGLATAPDFLRTLPQVFGGGPNLNTELGREAATNSNFGAGVNLRGLDAGATLVLIDGKRIAPSGTAGAFDDVSNIPLGIVDHIDVMAEGAGATYGADAVGGVVNFVTRRNFSGTYTQARDGGITDGHMGERQFSQLFGRTRESGSDTLFFEYYQRDALHAEDRWQETSDLTPYGGDNFNLMYGSPGTITDGLSYWPLPKGQNGMLLNPASLSQGAPNLYDQDLGKFIIPAEKRWSLFGRTSSRLTDELEVYGEGLFTQRKVRDITKSSLPLYLTVPESNPFYINPTGQPGPVTVVTGTSAYVGPPTADNRIDTGRFAIGASRALSSTWSLRGNLSYAFEKQRQTQDGFVNSTELAQALADPNPATAFNPFGDGAYTNPATLAAIRGTSLYESLSSLKTVDLRAKGGTLALPAGDVEAIVGTEYRIQSLETTTSYPSSDPDRSGRLTRNIWTMFGELRVPLVGEANNLAIVKRLDLSFGARREAYSDVGSRTIPKFGMLWSPLDDLSFRATWTKAFRPPTLADMVPAKQYNAVYPLADPFSASGVTTVLIRSGTNPGLSPETARTWTFGADFVPKNWLGASFSLTYFNIAYSGRIQDEPLTPDVLSQSDLGWLVNRNFTQAQLQDACSHGAFQSVATCTDSSIGAIIDNRLHNVALLKTSGIDFVAKYAFGGRFGKFELGLNSTYLLNFSQANTPGSALVDIVSTQNHPIDLRARGSAAWTRHGLGLAAFVNFQNSYRDTQSVPARGISPWTTIDMQLSYETTGDTLSWLGHTQFALNAQNLFNVDPPFLNNPIGVGYDQENAVPFGRLVSVEVRKRW